MGKIKNYFKNFFLETKYDIRDAFRDFKNARVNYIVKLMLAFMNITAVLIFLFTMVMYFTKHIFQDQIQAIETVHIGGMFSLNLVNLYFDHPHLKVLFDLLLVITLFSSFFTGKGNIGLLLEQWFKTSLFVLFILPGLLIFIGNFIPAVICTIVMTVMVSFMTASGSSSKSGKSNSSPKRTTNILSSSRPVTKEPKVLEVDSALTITRIESSLTGYRYIEARNSWRNYEVCAQVDYDKGNIIIKQNGKLVKL